MVLTRLVPPVSPRAWLREPLVHFLLAGFAMFVAVSLWNGAAGDERTIRISRDDLLNQMQGQAQVYDEETFSALLEAMPEAERQALVRETALQEALYREGEAIGLAKVDPLIRTRIVQQARLLLMEEAAADVSLSEAEIDAYYADHRADYRMPEQASFTHVFFSGQRGDAQARQAAEAELARLRAGPVPFERAGEHGERFLYQLNYADADRVLVSSHFGEEFAGGLFEAATGRWAGPLRSGHGWHLVLVRERENARLLTPGQLGDRLRQDALAAKRTRLGGSALDALLERYDIVTDPDLAQ